MRIFPPNGHQGAVEELLSKHEIKSLNNCWLHLQAEKIILLIFSFKW